MERLFARLTAQPIFRTAWQTDLTHFAISHLLVQVTVLLTLAPATVLFAWAARPRTAGRDPGAARCCYSSSRSWSSPICPSTSCTARFTGSRGSGASTEIHHSAEAMDWLASARLHLVDIVVTRGLSSRAAVHPGLLAARAVRLSDLRLLPRRVHPRQRALRFRAIEQLVVTPRFHHWHHAVEPEAVDTNFAIHLPIIDRLWSAPAISPPADGLGPTGWPARRCPTVAAPVWLAVPARARRRTLTEPKGAAMAELEPVHLMRWIEQNHVCVRPAGREHGSLPESEFVSDQIVRGPNARNDFHLDPGDEIFYQLTGDITRSLPRGRRPDARTSVSARASRCWCAPAPRTAPSWPVGTWGPGDRAQAPPRRARRAGVVLRGLRRVSSTGSTSRAPTSSAS